MDRALMRPQSVDIVELRREGLEFAKANLAGSSSRVHEKITDLLPSLPLAVQRLALYVKTGASGGDAAMHPGGNQRALIKVTVSLR
jgi:hypothetical protein